MPHIPISSYNRISASPRAAALMLYQLSLGAVCAVSAAMGASSARLLVVRIGASSVIVTFKLRPRHGQISPMQVDQAPSLFSSDHLAHAEIDLLHSLHRRRPFLLRGVIGVRTAYPLRLAVGLGRSDPAALEFLRVALTAARHIGLISNPCLSS